MATQTFEIWRARVAGAVVHVTGEQIDAIARACFTKTEAGIGTGVWHETAAYFGNLDRCPCYPCRKARGEER